MDRELQKTSRICMLMLCLHQCIYIKAVDREEIQETNATVHQQTYILFTAVTVTLEFAAYSSNNYKTRVYIHGIMQKYEHVDCLSIV